jgi:hypothetical protein
MVVALLASEYAHSPTILATFAACAVIPAVVGRPWTLLLPVALIVGVLAAGLSSWVYERVPEDIQAGIFIGAASGSWLGRWRSSRGSGSPACVRQAPVLVVEDVAERASSAEL